ncbi:MAG: Tfp pilus assembly protein FimT/FimU [Gemmataceae bacterium]
MKPARTIRRAITLVELLVVMAIMGTLAGIVVLFGPKMLDQARVPDAARQLQGWLQIARQRAVRDGAPRGLRLVTDPSLEPTLPPINGVQQQDLYHKFVYIEQPEDISVTPFEFTQAQRVSFQNDARTELNRLYTVEASKPAPNFASFYQSYRDLVDPGMNPNGWQYLLWLPGRNLQGTFQKGDIIEFGSSRYYLVTDAISVPSSNPTDSVFVLHRTRDEKFVAGQSPPQALPAGRITRGMQPIAGEPELELPSNTAIDVMKILSAKLPNTRSMPAPSITAATGAGQFDIVFDRTGQVTGGLGSYGRIILWVRDYSLGETDLPGQPGQPNRYDLPPGDNRLIVIHCRTGQVTAHPVNTEVIKQNANLPKLSDPYKFIRDGKSSAVE